MPATPTCPVCGAAAAAPFRMVEDVDYFKCRSCGSLFADPAFLDRAARGEAQTYQAAYWEAEMKSARERCYGAGVARVAETLLYCRRPVRRFLDVGAGSGLLLDAMAALLPSATDVFHAVDMFPPPAPYRTTSANFTKGRISDLTGPFDAGICVEVIEHLVPSMLRGLLDELAAVSAPGALYLFNSGQPDFVENEDPGYLDPHKRGHIVSYSVAGARAIFQPAGFNVIGLPGRDWAFLAEYGPPEQVSFDALYTRLWTPDPENLAMLRRDPFGNLLYATGLDSARCYLELGRARAAAQPPPPPAPPQPSPVQSAPVQPAPEPAAAPAAAAPPAPRAPIMEQRSSLLSRLFRGQA
jgi:SAM-dependent methyltransferase